MSDNNEYQLTVCVMVVIPRVSLTVGQPLRLWRFLGWRLAWLRWRCGLICGGCIASGAVEAHRLQNVHEIAACVAFHRCRAVALVLDTHRRVAVVMRRALRHPVPALLLDLAAHALQRRHPLLYRLAAAGGHAKAPLDSAAAMPSARLMYRLALSPPYSGFRSAPTGTFAAHRPVGNKGGSPRNHQRSLFAGKRTELMGWTMQSGSPGLSSRTCLKGHGVCPALPLGHWRVKAFPRKNPSRPLDVPTRMVECHRLQVRST